MIDLKGILERRYESTIYQDIDDLIKEVRLLQEIEVNAEIEISGLKAKLAKEVASGSN